MKPLILFLTLFSFLHAAHPDAHFKHPDDPAYFEITSSANAIVTNGTDVFITADFLYWSLREDGLGFAMSGFGNATSDPSKGGVHHIRSEFEPGFKVGLGGVFYRNHWDLYFQYTHLATDPPKRREERPFRSLLQPLWRIGVPNNEVNSAFLIEAQAQWEHKFNVVDGELGYNHFISQFLTLRPFIGLKGARQIEHYRVRYLLETSPNLVDDIYRMKNDQNIWGFGIRGGLNTSWHLSKVVSIYGNFAITGLWSYYDVERKDVQITEDKQILQIFNHEVNRFHTIIPVIEVGLGAKFETYFLDDDYHIALQVGWEEQVYMDFNQLIRFDEESSHGDLIMQGVTIKLRFDF